MLSAFTALETSVVVEAKKGESGGCEFDLLVHKANLDIVPMDAGQAELARSAWRKYGKGRHTAGLNIGDCCSYALARHTGEPLLFNGEDFAKTDAAGAALVRGRVAGIGGAAPRRARSMGP